MRNGIFLSPGAARGAYQVGVVDTLVREGGLHFDVIAATSVGALNGGFLATGQTRELVAEWSSWTTRDVLRFDWLGLLRGGVVRARALMDNRPEQEVIYRFIDQPRLLPGVRFRINLANLGTGDQAFLEWPGADLDVADAVIASVAVPGAVRPSELSGEQWADGLTVDGAPLEEILLATGVERAFVVGVAPRLADQTLARGPYRVTLRALECNQFSEILVALERAEAANQRAAAWSALRASALAAVDEELAADDAERARVAAEVDRAFSEAGLPGRSQVVELVPILPERNTRMMFGDFRPARSRALIEEGRRDARAVLAALGLPGGAEAAT